MSAPVPESAPAPEAAPESALEAPHADAGESRHRYPLRAVLLDYLYGALGLLFTLVPLLAAAPAGGPAAWVLGALAALFAVYGARTALRHRTCLRVSEAGIAVDGVWRRRLPWERLTRVTLGYYSTRRKRDSGWMQLTLKAERRTFRIDSQIDGFEQIVRRATRAAAARGIALDNATAENLRALGIDAGAANGA